MEFHTGNNTCWDSFPEEQSKIFSVLNRFIKGFRHTTALHLLQSGVDLNTIRCWLGHADVTTTNRYVEIDLEMKRKALSLMAAPAGQNRRLKIDDNLLGWLESI